MEIWFSHPHPTLFCQPKKCGRLKNRGAKNNFLLAPLANNFLVPFSQIALQQRIQGGEWAIGAIVSPHSEEKNCFHPLKGVEDCKMKYDTPDVGCQEK